MDGVKSVVCHINRIVFVDHDRSLTDRLPHGGIRHIDVVGIEVTPLHFTVLDRVMVPGDIDPRAVVIVI